LQYRRDVLFLAVKSIFIAKLNVRRSALAGKRLVEVKYEQFVKQPREMSKRLNELTGLCRFDELEIDLPAALQLENNEKWRSLPAEERQRLESAFPPASAVA